VKKDELHDEIEKAIREHIAFNIRYEKKLKNTSGDA